MEKKKLNTYVLAFKTYFKKLSVAKQTKILNELTDVYLQQPINEKDSKQRIHVQSEEDCEYSGICAMLD